MLNDKHVIFRFVVLYLPQAPYAYKTIGDRDFMLKKSAIIDVKT